MQKKETLRIERYILHSVFKSSFVIMFAHFIEYSSAMISVLKRAAFCLTFGEGEYGYGLAGVGGRSRKSRYRCGSVFNVELDLKHSSSAGSNVRPAQRT